LKLLSHIPAWMRNKYLVATLAFVVVMLFFGDNDLVTQYYRTRELQKLNAGKKYYNEEIKTAKKELNLLLTNISTLEKYAREKYWMKKDNEDLYIIPNTAPAASVQ
jgi:cell division protein DivIC